MKTITNLTNELEKLLYKVVFVKYCVISYKQFYLFVFIFVAKNKRIVFLKYEFL